MLRDAASLSASLGTSPAASALSQDLTGVTPPGSVASSSARPRSILFCSPQVVHANVVEVTKDTRHIINKVIKQIIESNSEYRIHLGFPGNSKAITGDMMNALAAAFPKVCTVTLKQRITKVCASKRGYEKLRAVAIDVGAEGPMAKRIKGLSVKKETADDVPPKPTASILVTNEPTVVASVHPRVASPVKPVAGSNPKPSSSPAKARGPPGSPAPYSFLGSDWVLLVY